MISVRQSATIPALPSLTIAVPRLPWLVVAHASSLALGVSVMDVLSAISRDLGMLVSRREWEEEVLGNSLRWRSGKGTKPRPWQLGMTRLDLLEGYTRFGGLVQKDDGSVGFDGAVWLLNLC
ncbi:unnamed protein product [Mycena citricolor]|uniref:DUF6699 domain-containing protein n=1 Tax=Mycena citricolor TaxID=2018698 RepID=A0AAD2HBV2_9AGAR|nr:unnamed protein product [Mycena citricolor]